jgi:hypothetical protein
MKADAERARRALGKRKNIQIEHTRDHSEDSHVKLFGLKVRTTPKRVRGGVKIRRK